MQNPRFSKRHTLLLSASAGFRALSLLMLLGFIAGCASPFEDSPFCLGAAVNKFDKSDGPSAPINLSLTAPLSVVVVKAAAHWDEGAVGLEIWDENGIPVWSQPLAKLNRGDTPQVIRSDRLKPGEYRLVNVANAATKGTVCMAGTVEATP
jgi:hypothetical protein